MRPVERARIGREYVAHFRDSAVAELERALDDDLEAITRVTVPEQPVSGGHRKEMRSRRAKPFAVVRAQNPGGRCVSVHASLAAPAAVPLRIPRGNWPLGICLC